VLRDVQQGHNLKKNILYKDTDFEKVKRNIEETGHLVNKQMEPGYVHQQPLSDSGPDD